MEHFERQYTEGHDLTGDIRYNQWLQVAHPDTTFLAHLPNVSQGTVGHFNSVMATFTRPSESVGQLSRFLKHPMPPTKRFTSRTKASSRVLISSESIKLMEEKEHQKKAKEEEKEQRKRAAEEKKRTIQEKRKQKDLEKEQKRLKTGMKNWRQGTRKDAHKGTAPGV